MVMAPLSLKKDYWQNFEVEESDLEFLYNHLLESETPQNPQELIEALVSERIRNEKEGLQKQQQAGGAIYYPKDHFQVGQSIQIPSMDWRSGKVMSTRPGHNPEVGTFEVIEIQLENGEKRTLAAGLDDHRLNDPISIDTDDPLLDVNYVLENFGEDLEERLSEYLVDNPDLVRIAGKYFPRALLVDINVGHLNLAEAVLDMMGGGPLPTRELMEQIELPTDVESNLNEFSLNLALQEDKRFDEVGPTGEVLWFLHRLEPEPVREVPQQLRSPQLPQPAPEAFEMLPQFEGQVLDELEPGILPGTRKPSGEATIALIFPHWRTGTLPLAGVLREIFPSALESPRIKFTFVDGNIGDRFDGWVVRPNKYVYGLREWYLAQGLTAGSLVHVQPGSNPGEVQIRADRKRGAREWIRTAMIGSDGGIVFSMLKHSITAAVDERMGIVISDIDMLDTLWEKNLKQRVPLSNTVRQIMIELAKLSPQGHVHAQELYGAVNILRRCPPSAVLNVLLDSPWAKHLGNLYYRLDDSSGGEDE